MSSTDLHVVAQAVCRRAQRQGYILPSEIRAELQHAGLAENRWKEVVAQVQPALHYRHGRYYFASPAGTRVQQEQAQQRAIHSLIRELIRQHRRANAEQDRRRMGRIDFVQQVKVRTDDERELTLLSRDLSPSGIRLIGTRSLLGQKVRVTLPRGDGKEPCCLSVRILWTCAVGDDLYENGGSFVELLSGG